jgi:hypothetical protein
MPQEIVCLLTFAFLLVCAFGALYIIFRLELRAEQKARRQQNPTLPL